MKIENLIFKNKIHEFNYRFLMNLIKEHLRSYTNIQAVVYLIALMETNSAGASKYIFDFVEKSLEQDFLIILILTELQIHLLIVYGMRHIWHLKKIFLCMSAKLHRVIFLDFQMEIKLIVQIIYLIKKKFFIFLKKPKIIFIQTSPLRLALRQSTSPEGGGFSLNFNICS